MCSIDWYAERWVFLRLQLCIKEMHWNYTWLQLYSWSFDAFSSNSYNAWHLLIRCRWQSFRYFQLKLSKNILCTLSTYQSMHHTKQLVEKLSDGTFPPENILPHCGLCHGIFQRDQMRENVSICTYIICEKNAVLFIFLGSKGKV